MKIGELAGKARCTTETVRFYEKAGLLPEADRTDSNYRHYGPRHLERLRFVRNCRALDMTHVEIRALLGFMDTPGDDCGAINTLLDEHIGHVDARIGELTRLKAQLTELRLQCQSERAIEACGIVQGLSAMQTQTQAERHTHVG